MGTLRYLVLDDIIKTSGVQIPGMSRISTLAKEVVGGIDKVKQRGLPRLTWGPPPPVKNLVSAVSGPTLTAGRVARAAILPTLIAAEAFRVSNTPVETDYAEQIGNYLRRGADWVQGNLNQEALTPYMRGLQDLMRAKGDFEIRKANTEGVVPTLRSIPQDVMDLFRLNRADTMMRTNDEPSIFTQVVNAQDRAAEWFRKNVWGLRG